MESYVPVGPHLPDSAMLWCRQVTITSELITIKIRATLPCASCPVCGRSSFRVHSHYTRILADLSWHGTPVQLHLEVRRFFCISLSCPRRIFVERLPKVAEAHARKTVRLVKALRPIGFALGGEAGSRLAGTLGMPTSPDTLAQHDSVRPRAADSPSAGSGCRRLGMAARSSLRHTPV